MEFTARRRLGLCTQRRRHSRVTGTALDETRAPSHGSIHGRRTESKKDLHLRIEFPAVISIVPAFAED